MLNYAKGALPLTIKRAFEQPFYRDFWGTPTYIEAVECFDDLPTIGKAELLRYEPVLDEDDVVRSISHSTGSSGLLSFRVRSDKEVALVRKFQRIVATHSNRLHANRRLRIVIPSAFHGQVDHGSNDLAYVNLACSLATEKFAANFVNMLNTGVPSYVLGGEISAIGAGLLDAQVATRLVNDIGLKTRLKQFATFGGYLSRYWRQELEKTWGVTPLHSYSVSEISGGAIQCPKCGYLTFGPHTLANVQWKPRDTFQGRPVGRLNLTELLPYGYCQPLVKFDTGDLVQEIKKDDACCQEHEGGLRHLGRDSTSVWISDGDARQLIIPSNDVHELFDLPFLFREPVYLQLSSLENRDLLGPAKGSLDVRTSRLGHELIITTRFKNSCSSNPQSLKLRAEQIISHAASEFKIQVSIIEDCELLRSIPK